MADSHPYANNDEAGVRVRIELNNNVGKASKYPNMDRIPTYNEKMWIHHDIATSPNSRSKYGYWLENMDAGPFFFACSPLDQDSPSLLHKAVIAGKPGIIKLLVERYLAINTTGGYDQNFDLSQALIHLFRSATRTWGRALFILKYLVEKGARLNVCDKTDGSNLLHIAVHRESEIAAMILLEDAPTLEGFSFLTGVNNDMRTPLMLAIEKGLTGIGTVIIKAATTLTELNGFTSFESNANEERNGRHDSLHLACWYGRKEIVESIFDMEKKLTEKTTSELVNIDYGNNTTPLNFAIQHKHYDIATICIKEGANVMVLSSMNDVDSTQLLRSLALAGVAAPISLMREVGASINGGDENGNTALHLAATQGHLDTVKALIASGAKLDARNKDGMTAMLTAAEHCHDQVFKALFEEGANFLAKDNKWRNAVHFATLTNNVHIIEMVMNRVLTNKPTLSSKDFMDKTNNTPVHYAAEFGKLEALQSLLRYSTRIKVYALNRQGRTALHLAATKGHDRIVQDLLRTFSHKKMFVDLGDREGESPLHLAAQAGENEVIKILVEVGKANIDTKARGQLKHYTPLHHAARKGLIDTCEFLLDLGAQIEPDYVDQTSALQLAVATGNSRLVSMLIDRGADVTRKQGMHNCLDLAIRAKQRENALAIIRSPKWRQALLNDYSHSYSNYSTPMAGLIRTMPDVAKLVFDKCLDRLPKDQEERKAWERRRQGDTEDEGEESFLNNDASDGITTQLRDTEEEFYFNFEFIEDEQWRRKCQLSSGRSDGDEGDIRNDQNLRLMVLKQRHELLSHPLIRGLLREKWKSFGLKMFALNIFLYILFMVFFNGYVISMNFIGPHKYRYNETLENYNGSLCEKFEALHTDNNKDIRIHTFAVISRFGIWITSLLLMCGEVLQFLMSFGEYVTRIDNYLEWFVYLSSILIVFDITDCAAATGLREDWQWQIGAMGIFFCWVNLLLFIRRLPVFGLYVVMFTNILRSFLIFFPVLLLFLVAFGMSFYTLRSDEIPFRYVMTSITKVAVMMLGEMDYGALFDDRFRAAATSDKKTIWQETSTYIIFILFMVVLAILVMNLLVGLAVDNIQEVTHHSQQQTLALQTSFLLDAEVTAKKLKAILRWLKCRLRTNTSIYVDVADKSWQTEPVKWQKTNMRRYSGNTGTRLARNWVLSDTSIIEEWHNRQEGTKPSDVTKLAPATAAWSSLRNRGSCLHTTQLPDSNDEIFGRLEKIQKGMKETIKESISEEMAARHQYAPVVKKSSDKESIDKMRADIGELKESLTKIMEALEKSQAR